MAGKAAGKSRKAVTVNGIVKYNQKSTKGKQQIEKCFFMKNC